MKYFVSLTAAVVLLIACESSDVADVVEDVSESETAQQDAAVEPPRVESCPVECPDDEDPCTYEECHPAQGCLSYERGQYMGYASVGGSVAVDEPRHMLIVDNVLYVGDAGRSHLMSFHVDSGAPLGIAETMFVGNTPTGMALHPSGPLFIGDGSSSGALRTLDFETGDTALVLGSPAAISEANCIVVRPDGHMLICSGGTDEIILVNESGKMPAVLVGAQSGGLIEPADAQLGPDGLLYVSSFGNNAVLRFDAMTGDFQGEFVTSGSGGLQNPRALRFHDSPTGWVLLVASAGTNEVLRYDGTSGVFLDVLVSAGEGMLEPYGLAVSEQGDLFVSAVGSGEVRRFAVEDGVAQGTISEWTGNYRLSQPTFLRWHDGALYVASEQWDSVYKMDDEANVYAAPFISNGAGGLDNPTGLAFGADGYLYVNSRGTNEILRFDASTGAFDSVVASGMTYLRGMDFGPAGHLYVGARIGPSADNVWRVWQVDVTTGGAVEFSEEVAQNSAWIYDLTFGPDGLLYVASFSNDLVNRFDAATGAYVDDIAVMSVSGGAPNPYGVTFGPDGLLYVAYNYKVRRFDPVSNQLIDVFFSGTYSGTYERPTDNRGPVAFDDAGRLYFGDRIWQNVLVLAPPLGPCAEDGCATRSYCGIDAEAGCQATTVPADGIPCDDEDDCTVDDQCSGGSCTGTPLDCDDEDPCTLDACDGNGGCINTPVADDTPCDDGDICTDGDECAAGVCEGKQLSCSDDLDCTDDWCDPVLGCQNTPQPDGASCSLEVCPSPGECVLGVCMADIVPLPDPCHGELQVPAHQFTPMAGKVDSSQNIDLYDLEGGSVPVGNVPVLITQPADPATGIFKGEGPVHGPALVATGDAGEELALTVQLASGTMDNGDPLPCPVAVHVLLLWDSANSTIEGLLSAKHSLEIAALDGGGNVVVGVDGNPLEQLFTGPPGGPPPADVLLFEPPGLKAASAMPDCGGISAIRVRFPASASPFERNLPFYHVMMSYPLN